MFAILPLGMAPLGAEILGGAEPTHGKSHIKSVLIFYKRPAELGRWRMHAWMQK